MSYNIPGKSIEFSQPFTSTDKTFWATVKTVGPFALNNAVLILKRRYELARQRQQLAHLDAAQLRDIGVSRQAAMAEAARSLSDDPQIAPQISLG